MKPYKISIGTANFANKYGLKNNNGLKIEEIEKILELGFKKGIRNIDTAQTYGNSESILGKLNLNKWKISTKINIKKSNAKKNDQIFSSVEKSLRRLRINYIENLFIHNDINIFNEKELSEIFYSLNQLKEKKIIKNFGCSIYTIKEFNKLINFSCLKILQAPLNIFNRKFLDQKITKYLLEKNIKLQFRSIFLQGLLLVDYKNIPKKFYDWRYDFKRYQIYLEKVKITKIMAALSILNEVKYSSVVIGFDSEKQLEEVLKNLPNKKINIPKFNIKNAKFIADPRKW